MAKQKTALGRGLGALLPVGANEPDLTPEIARTKLYNFQDRVRAAGRVSEIGVHLIDPNPYQPRSVFEPAAMEELIQSIRQLGIIQPVTVRSVKGGRYQLISGERRLRASKSADLTTIPAFVREAKDDAMLEMAIVENIQRSDLNPIDVALGYKRLMEECSLTQEKVSERVSKSRAAVTNTLRLLRLAPEIQSALKIGTVSAGHARPLLSLDAHDQQVVVLAQIEREGLSVRAVEELVREILNRKIIGKNTRKTVPAPEPSSMKNADVEVVRNRLRTQLGTQVSIKLSDSRKGGSIVVEFYSDEDLERIVDLLLD